MADYYRNSRSNKNTEKFFQLLVIGLCAVLLIFGVVGVVNAFTPSDAYDKVNFDYVVGEVITTGDNAGTYSDDCRTSLVSEKTLKCTGFKINSTFDLTVAYEVHFYTDNNDYVGYVTVTDGFYCVPIGEMPVLKNYVGDMTPTAVNKLFNDTYNNSESVLDEDGNEQVATNIRIVIRSSSTDPDFFNNLATKARVENSVTVKATAMPAVDKTDSSEDSGN